MCDHNSVIHEIPNKLNPTEAESLPDIMHSVASFIKESESIGLVQIVGIKVIFV